MEFLYWAQSALSIPEEALWMIFGSWLTLLADRWRLGDPVAKRIRQAIRETGKTDDENKAGGK